MYSEEITLDTSYLPKIFKESPRTSQEEIAVLAFIMKRGSGVAVTRKTISEAVGFKVSRVDWAITKLGKKNILVSYNGKGSMKSYRIKDVGLWSV